MWKNLKPVGAIFLIACVSWFTGCTKSTSRLNNQIFNAFESLAISSQQKIALLLPLEGPLANQANAIRNGFFAAYYQAKQSGPVPILMVLNTNRKDINIIYHQATQQGANFIIIGPLTKNNLITLMNSHRITLPTIALNTLSANRSNIHYLFQFGLSPIDEATQASIKMWNEQHRRIIMITPAGPWGETIAHAFQTKWQSLGGKVIIQFSYKNNTNLNNAIECLLNVDKAEQRAQQIRELLHEKVRALPRRRGDFDAIFLVANVNQARQIVPLLRFYYAGNVPIYATSSIYSPMAKGDNDIDGVIFDDMPWILSPERLPENLQQTRDRVQTLWPISYRQNSRLYALGVDAFNLIPQLGKLFISHYNFQGATGTLHLLPNQCIYRQLIWAKIINGQPKLL